jgi:hypothetical protein
LFAAKAERQEASYGNQSTELCGTMNLPIQSLASCVSAIEPRPPAAQRLVKAAAIKQLGATRLLAWCEKVT